MPCLVPSLRYLSCLFPVKIHQLKSSCTFLQKANGFPSNSVGLPLNIISPSVEEFKHISSVPLVGLNIFIRVWNLCPYAYNETDQGTTVNFYLKEGWRLCCILWPSPLSLPLQRLVVETCTAETFPWAFQGYALLYKCSCKEIKHTTWERRI